MHLPMWLLNDTFHITSRRLKAEHAETILISMSFTVNDTLLKLVHQHGWDARGYSNCLLLVRVNIFCFRGIHW